MLLDIAVELSCELLVASNTEQNIIPVWLHLACTVNTSRKYKIIHIWSDGFTQLWINIVAHEGPSVNREAVEVHTNCTTVSKTLNMGKVCLHKTHWPEPQHLPKPPALLWSFRWKPYTLWQPYAISYMEALSLVKDF